MKKIVIMLFIFIIISTLSGCNSTDDLLTEKIETDEIDKIQIRLAMGNPEDGTESKTIRDKNEISKIVYAFNSATIGERVKDSDIVIGDTSKYYFYNNDILTHEFSFNGNDSKRIWHDSSWHYIKYKDKKPYDLYKSSDVETIRVDEELNEIDKPIRKVSSGEIKKITPDMKYDDIIRLLGNTRDIGSGVYVLAYIVDEEKDLLISLMDKDTPCGRSGEELLQNAKKIKN